MVEQGRVAVAAAHDGYVTAGGANQEPLELASHEHGRVGQEVQARLDREQQQQGELVGPVQVVGDDYVVGAVLAGDVLPAMDLEVEREAKQRDADEPDEPVGDGGARPYGEKVGLRQGRINCQHSSGVYVGLGGDGGLKRLGGGRGRRGRVALHLLLARQEPGDADRDQDEDHVRHQRPLQSDGVRDGAVDGDADGRGNKAQAHHEA